jgi:hypothetical protein
MTKTSLIGVICLWALAAVPQQSDLQQRLLQGRSILKLENGRLAGSAVPLLQSAVAESQFVLIGEDHGIAQIAELTGAMCDLLKPQGFHTMAVETGSIAAAQLAQWLHDPTHHSRIAEFKKQYPEAIAFYAVEEEDKALSHCARVQGGNFNLWGLDQELFGSSGLILARILETHPSRESEIQLRHLMHEEKEAATKALQTGDVSNVFMFTAPDTELQQLRGLLHKQGNKTGLQLLDTLMLSREIYGKHLKGRHYESNRQRSVLLKENFRKHYEDSTRAEGRPPKVLLKFGGAHLYKGFNLFHNNDLGNYLAELADGQGLRSLHILVLGMHGTELSFKRFGDHQPVPVDLEGSDEFHFLKPLLHNTAADGWTVFDLRNLRRGFDRLGVTDTQLEHLVFGYDLLILIPEVTASSDIR